MGTLKFADTHNMVAFLSKPAKSEGFEQIVDFLNANPIRYALTINPIIYISCIEQFWSIVRAKTVNGEATPNEAGSQGTTSGGGPRRQETMGDTIAQTRFENVSKLSNNLLLARESKVDEKDVNLLLMSYMAQALAALKSVKPKVKANVVEEPSVPVSAASTKVSAAATTTTTTILTPRKGIIITELEEPVKSMTKKDLVMLDEEIASKLQAKFDEEERLAREKDEANVALTEEWDDIQAKNDADYQLAQRLQAQEQEELTD
ncbi:hypothetical protein Tco_1351574 [Tanacetum coccineum]